MAIGVAMTEKTELVSASWPDGASENEFAND